MQKSFKHEYGKKKHYLLYLELLKVHKKEYLYYFDLNHFPTYFYVDEWSVHT